MQLLRTGAFLRATRNARLAPHNVPSQGLAQTTRRWFNPSSRQLDSSPSAFPEQSISPASEVDPLKTGFVAKEAQNAQDDEQEGSSEFRDSLESQPRNTIVFDESRTKSGANILGQPFVFDQTSNLSSSILNLVGRRLYQKPNHPIAITRSLIESTFPCPKFKNHIASNPVVTTRDNFDVLGFPKDHPGRSRTDTYYVDSEHVLRTHTSAHQHTAFEYMSENPEVGYTICADVYRRDSIDRSHFPVFHQMEGARMWQLQPLTEKHSTRYQAHLQRQQVIKDDIDALPDHGLEIIDEAGPYHDQNNPVQMVHDKTESELVGIHMKRSLERLVAKVFTAAQQADVGEAPKKQLKVRWIEAYFPFTSPSWELEVFWQGEWLELLGCGVVKQSILNNAGLNDRMGWAWGIGIERLAMLLFNIPDIRLFWSEDPRFLNQFEEGKITHFKPFSKYPACHKDVTFWIQPSPAGASPLGAETGSGAAAAAGGDATKASPSETQPAAFHENDIMEIVRDVAGSMAEDVRLVDEFIHPKTGKKSLCYRINYRSLERTLTNEEANTIHNEVLKRMQELPIEIRDKQKV